MERARCPWDGFTPSNYDFCEANVCGWVVEPANTWSCWAYVLWGLFVFGYIARERSARNLWPLGASAILVGLLSGLYHASRIFQTEFLDLFSMYTLSLYALVVNLYRLFGISVHRLAGLYVGVLAACLVLLQLIKPIGVVLFAAQVVVLLGFEYRLYRRQRGASPTGRTNYRAMAWLIGFFVASLVVWLGDFTGLACIPESHWLQGHAAWHVLNSFCFYFLFRFYRQFDFGGGDLPARAGSR